MIKREDFIFTLGYNGMTAIVDGMLKREYGKYNTAQLAAAGLFKEAICSALYENNEQDIINILNVYNEKTEKKISSVENIKRVFGVFKVPEGITRVSIV